MKLLRLTLDSGKDCYINPNCLQYFEELRYAPVDAEEDKVRTRIFMIGGKVAVLESPDEIENMLRWIDKS